MLARDANGGHTGTRDSRKNPIWNSRIRPGYHGRWAVAASSHAPPVNPMPSASRAVTICGVVAVLLAPTHTPAAAQAIPIGAHLRVRGQGNHAAVFRGRLRTISNDSIALALDDDVHGEPVPFAFADIGRAEMERDERTRDEAAAAVGAIGFAGGLGAAVYWCVHNQSDCADDIEQMQESADNDEGYIGPIGLMVLGGTFLGSIIGYALAPQPHWELVVFPTRTATSNGSSRLLMNVGVSIPLGGRRHR